VCVHVCVFVCLQKHIVNGMKWSTVVDLPKIEQKFAPAK